MNTYYFLVFVIKEAIRRMVSDQAYNYLFIQANLACDDLSSECSEPS